MEKAGSLPAVKSRTLISCETSFRSLGCMAAEDLGFRV